MFGSQFTALKYKQIRDGIILGRISGKWGIKTFIPINNYPRATRKAYFRTVSIKSRS